MSLIGIMHKQPRVFAHDAIPLAVNGAGIISDPVIAGTGYTTGIKAGQVIQLELKQLLGALHRVRLEC